MIELYYNERDPRYIFLFHDNQTTTIKQLNRRTRRFEPKVVPEIVALEAHLNQIPSYQFQASFSGIPTPVCFLEKKMIGERVIYYCLTGLWKEIKDWCAEKKIDCHGIYNLTDFGNPDKRVNRHLICTNFNESVEDLTNYINAWGLNLDGI